MLYNGVGCPDSPWPGRVEAVMTAFAIEAAMYESAPSSMMEMLPGVMGAMVR